MSSVEARNRQPHATFIARSYETSPRWGHPTAVDSPADPMPLAENAVNTPIRTSASVGMFGRTLVVAPHPDDETLGCGGTIALLRKASVRVDVLVVSDGAASHPNSKRFRKPRLAMLRETESLTALDQLGVMPPFVKFLRLPDGDLPRIGEDRFSAALELCVDVLRISNPSTVLVPWRRDPHHDHRATWELVTTAAIRAQLEARWLEYPVWLWEYGQDGDVPSTNEVAGWRLDISSVLPLKRRALCAYRSQISDLIDDDPSGFRLSVANLAHFDQPWEIFFEDGPSP